MGQIIVRNLDDEVIVRLKAKAEAANLSLEQSVRNILEAAAKPSREELWSEIDRIRSMSPPSDIDSTALIREDRDNVEPYR
jgi:plasmid stability protein